MHLNGQLIQMVPQQQQTNHTSGEGDVDHGCTSNSVALEIGKDFLLPDSSVMPDTDEGLFTPRGGSSSASSSPHRLDYQSQLHPSDEENNLIVQCRREKNRKAAQKCREKKKERIRFLENTVKDLNNDIRILKCQNTQLEDEKERLAYVLKMHSSCCPLKTETDHKFSNAYSVEEKYNPTPEQLARISHQAYREETNMQSPYNSYLYQLQTFQPQ